MQGLLGQGQAVTCSGHLGCFLALPLLVLPCSACILLFSLLGLSVHRAGWGKTQAAEWLEEPWVLPEALCGPSTLGSHVQLSGQWSCFSSCLDSDMEVSLDSEDIKEVKEGLLLGDMQLEATGF